MWRSEKSQFHKTASQYSRGSNHQQNNQEAQRKSGDPLIRWKDVSSGQLWVVQSKLQPSEKRGEKKAIVERKSSSFTGSLPQTVWETQQTHERRCCGQTRTTHKLFGVHAAQRCGQKANAWQHSRAGAKNLWLFGPSSVALTKPKLEMFSLWRQQ